MENSNLSQFVMNEYRRVAFLCIFLLIPFISKTQIQYATTISAQDHASSASNSVDANPLTYSEISASSGALLGIGAYQGYVEMKFPSVVPANTTVYVRVETEDDILSSLVGGTLGNLVSGVSGVVLVGNQEFTVEVKDASNNVVLSGQSTNPASFGGERLKVVINRAKENYLLITPSVAFQSIRITTAVGSLLGLGTTRTMKIYDPYYRSGSSNCSAPTFTSYDGTGISLEALNLGGGVSGLEKAIDDNFPTFSKLSLGVVSVASSITQYVYFETPSLATGTYGIRFQVDPALLNIGISQNVKLIFKDGATQVSNQPLANYLTPANTADLQNGLPTTIFVSPGVPVDRVIVHFNGILGVTISQSFELNEVYRVIAPPVLNVASSDTITCEGFPANLVATTSLPANEIRWYTNDSILTPVGNVASGVPYTTGPLTNDTVLWAASAISGCPRESNRIPIQIDVLPAPDSTGLVNTSLTQYCASDSLVLGVTNTDGDQFHWSLTPGSTTSLPAGTSSQNGYTYIVQGDTLVIASMPAGDTSFTIYVSYQDSATGCWNIPGNEYQIPLTINDESVPTTTDDIQYFCNADAPVISSISINETSVNWYDENGNTLTSSSPLSDSTMYFATLQGAVCESSDTLSVLISISALPTPTTQDSIQLFCGASHPTVGDLQTDQSSVVWFNQAGDSLSTSTLLTDSTTYYAILVSPSCQSDGQLAVHVLFEDPYNVHFIGDTSNLCLMDTVEYHVSPGMNGYNWVVQGGSIVNGGTTSDSIVSAVWNDTAGGSIWVSYVSNSGCLIQTQNAIQVSPTNCSNIEIHKTVDELNPMVGQQITFTITVSNSGVAPVAGIVVNEQLQSGFTYISDQANYGSYDLNAGEWTIPLLPGGDTAVLKIKVTVNSTGIYTNIASVDPGKTNLPKIPDPSEVDVNPHCLKVYNEISPNGDGVNDYLHIDCINQFPDNSVEIFNRYGAPVFKVKGYKNNWDGVANVSGVVGKGTPLPAGTYYYILKVKEKNVSTSGWVYIIR